MSFFLVVFVAIGIGLWLVSLAVEALRPTPKAPRVLSWAPEVPLAYCDVDGFKLRYIKAGHGPNVVLLHTLRTQLDLFQNIVPVLGQHFTVYAVDYPGHGFSDIPNGRYDADFFARFIERFLDVFDLRDVTLCGVSIGGAIALILAGRHNTRVARVVAINPYDYAQGRGLARSSLAGWLITTSSRIPILGETVMRLRNFSITKAILRGGVTNAESIAHELLKEMYVVGNRREHYRAFITLLRNSASWEVATKVYGDINVPVLLVWGDKDWSTLEEREHEHSRIPSAEMVTVANAGHFLPLDRPDAVVRHIERALHSAETTERAASRLSGEKPCPLSAIRNSNTRVSDD